MRTLELECWVMAVLSAYREVDHCDKDFFSWWHEELKEIEISRLPKKERDLYCMVCYARYKTPDEVYDCKNCICFGTNPGD